jgi:hypothetical protein
VPALRNAFKYRLADRQSLDTGLFLHLYCPMLLDQLTADDFTISKLLVLRGSPGSGKSSFLRLFQTESLVTLYYKRIQPSDDLIAEALTELGVFTDDGIRYIGLYIQCDSNLRDLANADVGKANLRLLNTLLDVRVTLAYLRGLRHLFDSGAMSADLDAVQWPALPAEETPPPLFAQARTVKDLEAQCMLMEAHFATLLNSFPGDPLPDGIVPHSRVFAFAYLAQVIALEENRRWPKPIVLIDDLQELYDAQRQHLRAELLRRTGIPRWVAVRKYVYELEELLPLEGTKDGRDLRELDLDQPKLSAFRRFLENVTERRLRSTDALQQFTTLDFRSKLTELPDTVPLQKARKGVDEILSRLAQLGALTQPLASISGEEISLTRLLDFELQLILAERKAARDQPYIFEELAPPEPSNPKTEQAARLFMCQRHGLPYYVGFDALGTVANGNVEQYLEVAGTYADKMIFRAELSRTTSLSPREQHDLLRTCATRYYERIEQEFPRGYTIRHFVENLARFCQAVTDRPTAPIAPGVTGFGLTREQLRDALALNGADDGIKLFRETLASAVAGNVLSVKKTKQGQPGAHKLVFYLNRLLCVHFNLPLNYGGWQRLPVDVLIKMMRGPVPAEEWGKKWKMQPFESDDSE